MSLLVLPDWCWGVRWKLSSGYTQDPVATLLTSHSHRALEADILSALNDLFLHHPKVLEALKDMLCCLEDWRVQSGWAHCLGREETLVTSPLPSPHHPPSQAPHTFYPHRKGLSLSNPQGLQWWAEMVTKTWCGFCSVRSTGKTFKHPLEGRKTQVRKEGSLCTFSTDFALPLFFFFWFIRNTCLSFGAVHQVPSGPQQNSWRAGVQHPCQLVFISTWSHSNSLLWWEQDWNLNLRDASLMSELYS